jgi:hypothetical protein
MKQIVTAAVLASLPLVSQAAEMPLKRVVLSTSGLAQFTHAGENGDLCPAASGAFTPRDQFTRHAKPGTEF